MPTDDQVREAVADHPAAWAGTAGPAAAAPAALTAERAVKHVDVLIVGAGLSGIAGAYHLQQRCPEKTFAILEAREASGGTWELFRYPGVRSDSDIFTLGFSFRPWESDRAIVDGPSILKYLRDTAAEFGIDRKISYQHRVTRASWSSAEARWTVEVEIGPDRVPALYSADFLYLCTGYYDYDQGYRPGWPGMERFGGRIVDPQHWPEALDYAGRRVVVIGSGATAVGLVPELAKQAAHVTMLQRSPTYVVSLPGNDTVARWLQRRFPARVASALIRAKNVLFAMYFYKVARARPEFAKRMILKRVQEALGPACDVARHFTPNYNPWDQRLCLVPDEDLFNAIKSGKASVVTDTIESFTETGIALQSGERLDADIIVTATGLKLKVLGGIQLVLDGAPVDLSQSLIYKGAMYGDVPNLVFALGYANASWTLKCELSALYFCRLLKHMAARNYAWCAPRRGDAAAAPVPFFPLTSGYIRRASAILPKQGTKSPWKFHQNYALDLATLRFGAIDDGVMVFGHKAEAQRAA